MKISKILEKISTTIVDSKDDVNLTDEQLNNILSKNPLIGSYFSSQSSSKKYKLPQESDFSEKDIKHICKSLVLEPNTKTTVEICSLFSAFRPSTLIIKVVIIY